MFERPSPAHLVLYFLLVSHPNEICGLILIYESLDVLLEVVYLLLSAVLERFLFQFIILMRYQYQNDL
jgi:hypothetical protein